MAFAALSNRKVNHRMGRGTAQATQRLSSDDRREHILAVANRLIADTGLTSLSMERLARACGVSKALIYAHFPSLAAVLDGVVRSEFNALEFAGIARALTDADPHRAAAASALIYFRHIVSRGSALHIILTNPSICSQFSPATRGVRDRLLRRMAKAIRKAVDLPIHDSVAAAILLTSVPERAAQMVAEGRVDSKAGAELCELLTGTTLQALSPSRVPAEVP